MNKKILTFLIVFLVLFSYSFSQAKQIKIIAEKASVYLDSSKSSYLIETLGKGKILDIYGLGKATGISRDWYYVYYKSKRMGSVVTGFIEAFKVELLAPQKIVNEKNEGIIKEKVITKEPEEIIEKEEKIEIQPRTKEMNFSTKTRPSKRIVADEITKNQELEKEYYIDKKRLNPITLGIGFGQSHGGFGGFIQLNTKSGISFHGGIGYFPTSVLFPELDWVSNTLLFSGGLKYYLPIDSDPIHLYLDLQYGGIGVKAALIPVGWNWYDGLLVENIQKTLWGPSFLGGMELNFGSFGLNGALGLSYNITELEWLNENLFLTLDFSLLIYF